MNLIYKFAFYCLVVLVLSCKSDGEPEVLISEIDGAAYFEEKNGEMNVRKAVHLYREGKKNEIPYKIFVDMADSLLSPVRERRLEYFDILNKELDEIEEMGIKHLAKNAFLYLLQYPDEIIGQIATNKPDHSLRWIDLLSQECKANTESDEITNVSVINMALHNCSHCADSTKELVIQFIQFLDLNHQ